MTELTYGANARTNQEFGEIVMSEIPARALAVLTDGTPVEVIAHLTGMHDEATGDIRVKFPDGACGDISIGSVAGVVSE